MKRGKNIEPLQFVSLGTDSACIVYDVYLRSIEICARYQVRHDSELVKDHLVLQKSFTMLVNTKLDIFALDMAGSSFHISRGTAPRRTWVTASPTASISTLLTATAIVPHWSSTV